MEVNQTFDELARAVQLAKPAAEYCLLLLEQSWWTCLTKAEWSGWMQVVGTVLAIYGAFALSEIQEYRTQLRLKKNAMMKVNMFALSVSVSAEALRDAVQVNEIEMHRQQALIRENLAVGVSISAEMLNAEWLAAFAASRAIAVQLNVLCEAVSKDLSLLPGAKKLAETFCGKMQQVENVLRKPHPGVKFKKSEAALPDRPFFTQKQ